MPDSLMAVNLQGWLTNTVERAFKLATNETAPAIVTPSSRPEFGDYQANGAMGLAKRIKTNPVQLAPANSQRNTNR